LPTNWLFATQTGIVREIIGAGTVNGLAYIDIRFSGTAANTGANAIQFEASTQVAALQNQVWTTSASVALVAGTLANTNNHGIGFAERDSGGGAIASGVLTSYVPDGTLTRHTATRTLTGATTAFYSAVLRFAAANTVDPIDLTLRIAAPQLEQGAFATSYIPTTTAAATRAAESAVVTPISSFYNQVESTIFSELSATSVAFDSTIIAINDSTQNEQIDQRLAITSVTMRARVGGVNQASMAGVSPVVAPVAGTVYKFVAAYKQDDFAASMDGATVVTDTSGNMPTGLSRMVIGSRVASAFLTGHIRKLAYWPKRLSNTLLEQLTT
jgi:hypothetical protein